MLLEPDRWSLAFRSDEVLAALPAELRDRVTLETHAAVMEIATGVHRRIVDAFAAGDTAAAALAIREHGETGRRIALDAIERAGGVL